MAINYDLNNTGPEVQARLDQVLPNEEAISQETANREEADESLLSEMKEYTDAETFRAQEAEGELFEKIEEIERNSATKEELENGLSEKANSANVYTKTETYSKEQLNNMITTPAQQYVSVSANSGTTSVTSLLPATGESDTIYRVGNWDGTQYNVDRYSEYAWNGTAYVLLSVNGFNLDAVPTAGSSNGVESGGVHRWFEEGLGLVRTPVSVTKNMGSFVSNTGSVVSLELGYITDPVPVKGGDVIELYTRSSQYATSIMITNEGGTILTLAKKGTGPGTSPWQTIHYYVQADCYVKFSGLEDCTVYKISTRQDKSLEDIRIHDYFDNLATTAWKGVIKELYINPKFLYRNTFEVDFLSHLTGAKFVGVGADGVTTTWEAETTHIFPHSEGTCFGIYCTTAGGEAALNDIIGYVVVDIAIFKTTQPTTLGNKLNLVYATNIDLCPSLSSVVNRSAREPIAEVLSLFVGKGITDLSEGIIAQSSRGYLIKASDGSKVVNANSHISTPMLLNEGDVLCGYCRLTTLLACLSKTDSGGTSYTPVYIGEGTGGDCPWQAWRYVVQESGYYALCWFGVSDVERPYFYKFDGTMGDGELMAFNLLSAYTNITCLGDSLTWSQVPTGEGTYRPAKRTFPQVIGGLCGNTGLAIGNPGDTAKRWWDTFSAQLIARTNNLYIVYLGTNGGLTDTIDTDCAGDDITNYADTNTGCYGKILGSIKALGDKAILVKINTVAYAETTNAVIEKFGDKFGFPVVGNDRIDNLLYHYYPDGSGYDNLHLNDLGYCYFANRLLKDIDRMTDEMKRRLVVE